MIIIYYCYGGTHSSVITAAIHTNKLPKDKIPKKYEFINLPYFDKIESQLIGTPFFYGYDNYQNEIYILGMGKAKPININTISSLIEIENIPDGKVIMINTLKFVNFYVRIGGFLSRRLKIVNPGRQLVIYGLKKNYHQFVEVVKRTKSKIDN